MRKEKEEEEEQIMSHNHPMNHDKGTTTTTTTTILPTQLVTILHSILGPRKIHLFPDYIQQQYQITLTQIKQSLLCFYDETTITMTRKSTSTGTTDSNDETYDDSISTIFQLLSKTIILPISSSSYIPTQNIHQTNNNEQHQSSSSFKNKNEKGVITFLSQLKTHPLNVYTNHHHHHHHHQQQQKRTTIGTKNESLRTLVDGIVYTLVCRKQKCQQKNKFHKKQKQQQQQQQQRSIKLEEEERLQLLYSYGNVLSAGYQFNSSSTTGTYYYECQNMGPGVHCSHPNFSVSYAKSSPLTQAMHNLLGDDIFRELMLHCFIFVPMNVNHNNNDQFNRHGHQNLRERNKYGNYFQLSGPPLSYIPHQSFFHKYNNNNNNYKKKKETHTMFPLSAKIKYLHTTPNSRKRKHSISKLDDTQTNICETPIGKNNHNNNKKKQATNKLHLPIQNNSYNDWDNRHTSRTIVQRKRLLYCEKFVKKIGLPSSHILNTKITNIVNDPNNKNTSSSLRTVIKCIDERLLQDMFQIHVSKKTDKSGSIQIIKRRRLWKRIRSSGLLMCNKMRKRHKKCDYARLLRRYCPLSHNLPKCNSQCSSESMNEDNTNATQLPQLVKQFSKPEGVVSFLKAVISKVFPQEFWGSKHNLNVIFDQINSFINLGRHDMFHEKTLLQNIRVNDILWISEHGKKNSHHHQQQKKKKISPSSHQTAVTLTRCMICWFYNEYIIPLLCSIFYVTETEFLGSQVVFYRKPVWSVLKRFALQSLKKENNNFEEINADDEKQSFLLTARNLGMSKLRLLPKQMGIRPLANLSQGFHYHDLTTKRKERNLFLTCFSPRNEVQDHSFHCTPLAPSDLRSKSIMDSTNYKLRDIHEVLSHKRRENPNLFASGLYGLDELLPRLIHFKGELEAYNGSNLDHSLSLHQKSKQTNLYFMSVDIKSCFDNINQNLLYDLIEKTIPEDSYLIQKFTKIQQIQFSENAKRKTVANVSQPENMSKFPFTVNKRLNNKNCSSSSIFVENVLSKVVKKNDLMSLLHEHIFQNIVAIKSHSGYKLLHQKTGIPQGSILSSMLCNIYYGHLEEKLLDGVFLEGESNDSSSHINESSELRHINLLLRMVDDFLLITTDQSTSNRFLKNMENGIPHLGVNINNVKTRCNYDRASGKMSNSTHFPWCGLLFHQRTCTVKVDYSRFTISEGIKDTGVNDFGNEEMNLLPKMKSFVTPRCKPILYDLRINSPAIILENFYESMLFCAVRTLNYISNSKMLEKSQQNLNFIHQCIREVIVYAFSLISSITHSNNNLKTTFLLKHNVCLWFGTRAFISVFKLLEHGLFMHIIDALEKDNSIVSKQIRNRRYLDQIATKSFKNFGVNQFYEKD